MARRGFDADRLHGAVVDAERVVTHAALRELGLSPSGITRRISPTGPWQRLLPGVVLAHRGTPTRRELILGALAYAGEGAVVTGPDAIRAAGGRLTLPSTIHLLTPVERQRSLFGFARIERSRRLPPAVLRRGVPLAPPARATIDSSRFAEKLDDVRGLIAAVVQERLCGIVELGEELRAAPRQRTAGGRSVVAEVSDGVRSVAEAKAREALAAHGVTPPWWNATLLRPDGSAFLTPDAFWVESCAALEIDSRAWHLRPADWHRTRRRQRTLTVRGIPVISFAPVEVIETPDEFAAETAAFLRTVGRRSLPTGWTVRRAA
ncbi:hypothetical protein ACIB24_08130 [Spongisporangium articulatum]|uniref:Transcriptional regulator, AbiEi antitoxin, Type IV TA system n=1 Tax=Spongisporangium articulatum TaxID=3362603 RepID=A0ABW8ALR2_9ACTN